MGATWEKTPNQLDLLFLSDLKFDFVPLKNWIKMTVFLAFTLKLIRLEFSSYFNWWDFYCFFLYQTFNQNSSWLYVFRMILNNRGNVVKTFPPILNIEYNIVNCYIFIHVYNIIWYNKYQHLTFSISDVHCYSHNYDNPAVIYLKSKLWYL